MRHEKNGICKKFYCHIRHEKTHLKDCEDCENPKAKIDKFSRELEVIGDLGDEQKQRLLEIADRCPVHRTLEGQAHIETTLLKT